MATIKPYFSIVIPTYNGGLDIKETINSVLNQDYKKFELIICDDNSSDNTIKIVRSINDNRIKIKTHHQNLGYPGNLERSRQYSTGEILFLMGQDDLLFPGTLKHYADIFKKYPKVGAITRPYYWFDKNSKVPVRRKIPLNPAADEIITITSAPNKVIKVFDTLDQLSGLAYRIKWFTTSFHPDIFPAHIYPFAAIFKKHPVVYVKDNNIAVRIASSQTRKISSIYQKSPILSWKQMIDTIFPASKYKKVHNYLIKDFVARNYLGLVQIKNYGKYTWVLREIYFLLVFRWQNIFSPSFWLITIAVLTIPSNLLIKLVDWYKNTVYKNIIKFNIFNFLYRSKVISTLFPTTIYCLQNALSDCHSVLDLGCGPDSPLQYCPTVTWSIGVDAFKPYIEQSMAKKIHQQYICQNINTLKFKAKSFDAVILIETLEHLSQSDGQALINKCQKWAKKKIIITTPNGYIHQKALDKNKYQQHLSGWNPKLFRDQKCIVHGLSGFKFLRAEGDNQSMSESFLTTIKYKPKVFWFIIATLSQALTYHFPNLAFELFVVQNVSKK